MNSLKGTDNNLPRGRGRRAKDKTVKNLHYSANYKLSGPPDPPPSPHTAVPASPLSRRLVKEALLIDERARTSNPQSDFKCL